MNRRVVVVAVVLVVASGDCTRRRNVVSADRLIHRNQTRLLGVLRKRDVGRQLPWTGGREMRHTYLMPPTNEPDESWMWETEGHIHGRWVGRRERERMRQSERRYWIYRLSPFRCCLDSRYICKKTRRCLWVRPATGRSVRAARCSQ